MAKVLYFVLGILLALVFAWYLLDFVQESPSATANGSTGNESNSNESTTNESNNDESMSDESDTNESTSNDSTTAIQNGNPEAKAAMVKELLHESSDHLSHGKLELALREVDTALEIDPKNVLAYQLRASIYTEKKLWDRAEDDYATAFKIAPSATVFKYNMAQIQFMQKAFDNARPGFLALRQDPMLGDLATYQVFLCDMLSGRDDVAARELDAINQAGASPGYYYSNAAWSLSHQNRADANKWLIAAAHLYPSNVNTIYLTSLVEAGSAQGTLVTFTTKRGDKYNQIKAYTEGGGLRILTTNGWVTIPFDQLPDDISVFPPEIQKEIAARTHLAPFSPSTIQWVSFTTKQGKHYEKVQIDVEDTGVGVLTSDGWLTIPFRQLPVDLSPFPEEMQREIEEKRATALEDDTIEPTYSFVTKDGTHYDDVRVWVSDSGLDALTSDGWLTIPFKQLPDDLSIFPLDIRKEIMQKRQAAPDDSTELEFFSFTTKKGQHYDQVQVAAEKSGLGVLTPDGWFTVPFEQLPDDLSVFPAKIRDQIKAKEQEAEDEAKQAALLAQTKATNPGTVTDQPGTTDIGVIDPEQADLHPAGAWDCLFGACVAVDGSTLVVGGNGATYVYEDNQLKARLCPDADTTYTGDQVNSVSISNNTIAAGTRKGVYVWVGTPGGWKLQAFLDITDPSTVVLDHDQLMVATNGKGITSGTVSFYARNGETWASVPRDITQNHIDYSADFFGHIIALKGQWALIGAPNWSTASYDNFGSLYSGRAYLEKFDGTTWKLFTELDPDDNGVGANQFGGSVALSDDFIAISSANHDHIDFAPHHGIVYLFHKEADAWKEEDPIRSPNPANDAGFGNAPIVFSQQTLAIGDTTVPANVSDVISVMGDHSGKPGVIKNAGAVYVYENRILQATLQAPDPVEGLNHHGSPDRYAGSIAVSGDTLAIGAEGKDGGTGAVYIWKRQEDQWRLETELKGFHKQVDFHY